MHSAECVAGDSYRRVRVIKKRAAKRRRRRRILNFFLMFFSVCILAVFASMVREQVVRQKLAEVPEELASLYERNPDARSFVLDYKEKHNKKPRIDLSKYADINTVPLLMHWDERWGYKKYSEQYFGLSGCGPTCLSMAYIYLTKDTRKSPDYMRKFATKNGFSTDGSGTAWAFITKGGEKLGLDVTELPLDKSIIDRKLVSGNVVICIMGPGKFTTGGHFIVIAGIENGKYRINDPNSYTNSNKLWEYDEISDQIKNLWSLSAR